MTRLSCSNSTHSPRGVFAALLVTCALAVSSAFAAGTKPNAAEPAYGHIDTSGALVIEPQYWGARRFAGGLAPVLFDGFVFGNWSFINRKGEMVIEPQFGNALPFSQGLAAVQPGDGFDPRSCINPQGQIVIEPQFDEAHLFANGRAAVNKGFGGGMYCIDRIGDRVFPWADYAYALALRFHGVLAHVTMKTRKGGWGTTGGPWLFWGEIPDASWRYVNRKGQQVWPPPMPQASGKHKQQSTREVVASTLSEYGYVPGTHLPRFIPTYDDTQLVDALAGYAAKAACLPPRPY